MNQRLIILTCHSYHQSLTCFLWKSSLENLLHGVLHYSFSVGLYVLFCSHQQVSFLVLLPVVPYTELCVEKTFCEAAVFST